MLEKGKELALSKLGIEIKAEENNVFQVTDSNFDELVMSS